MTGLTEKDMHILEYYAAEGNRLRYWNYLAQHEGSDGYGTLALGVVRNDNMPGAVANRFAQNYAKEHDQIVLDERGWENFGQDLIRSDFALREHQFYALGRSDLALNLPVKDVQKAHEETFAKKHININAWTPNRLLNAAYNHGGDQEMEKTWRQLLDNQAGGSLRMSNTLINMGKNYDNPDLHTITYLGEMARAYAEASQSLPYSNPNKIGGEKYFYLYDPQGKTWNLIDDTNVMIGGLGFPQKETNPKILAELNDARAVRLERNAKADQIAPGDPYQQIAKSPFVLAQHTSESPQHRVAAVSARDVAPRLYDELKSQLPAQTSPERLAQISFAAKQAGIKPGQIAVIEAQDTTLHVIGQTPGCRASIDLSTPPPSAQQTLQQAQSHDQQQALQQIASPPLAQHAQQNAPTMALRHPGMS